MAAKNILLNAIGRLWDSGARLTPLQKYVATTAAIGAGINAYEYGKDRPNAGAFEVAFTSVFAGAFGPVYVPLLPALYLGKAVGPKQYNTHYDEDD